MKPGWQTSEGWLTAFKGLAGTAALFATLFGQTLPASAGPEGQWIGVAAFIASTVAVIGYRKDRIALKDQALLVGALPPVGTQDSTPLVVDTTVGS